MIVFLSAPAEPKSHVVADPPLPAQPGLEWRREQERGGSQVRLGCLFEWGTTEGHRRGLMLCLVKLFFVVFIFKNLSLCVHKTYPSGTFFPVQGLDQE